MISERARLVSWSYLVSDLAATAAAFVAAHAIRDAVSGEWMGPVYPLTRYFPLLFGLILPVWGVVFYVAGLYGRRSARTLHTEVSRLFHAIVICGLVLAVAIVAARLTYVSRPLILLFLLLNAVFLQIGRGLVRAFILESAVRRRVLVAGGLDEVQRAAAKVEAHRDWGLELVGVVSDGTWGPGELSGYRHLGTYSDIPALTTRGDDIIDEVIVAPSSGRLDDLKALEPVFLGLEEQGIATRLVVSFLPRSASQMTFDEFGGLPLLTFSTAPHDELLLFIRRCVEVVAAAALIVVLSPLLLLIALLIKATSPGPVLFSQLRCGLNGRPFTFLKFRSMRVDAEALKKHLAPYNEMDGPAFKMTNDPRVTPLGRFLRRTSLDELPQLWNVLRGDMSFVGPRPERPEFVAELTKLIPFYGERHVVRPGLTGWAQVRHSYGTSVEDAMQKLQYDLYYIKNLSIALDLFIILETIKTVLVRRGS